MDSIRGVPNFLHPSWFLVLKETESYDLITTLECWNVGMLGIGVLQGWVTGKIRQDDKI
jgi:hypothetical protein